MSPLLLVWPEEPPLAPLDPAPLPSEETELVEGFLGALPGRLADDPCGLLILK